LMVGDEQKLLIKAKLDKELDEMNAAQKTA
jgi:hypothetical protein